MKQLYSFILEKLNRTKNSLMLEKLKINSKTKVNTKEDDPIKTLLTPYLTKDKGFNEDDYEISSKNDFIIKFNKELKLSYRNLKDIGEDIKQIFKQNRIHCMSDAMIENGNEIRIVIF